MLCRMNSCLTIGSLFHVTSFVPSQQLKNNLARTMVCGIAMCQQAKSKHAYGENLHPNKATVACVASYDDQCTKFVHSLMFQDKHAAILTEVSESCAFH